MKVFILAGGFGTRMNEETMNKPKPMVEIGGKPILWHILNIYSYHGFNDFYILLGFNGNHIKNYFANYYLYNNDVSFDLKNNTLNYLSDKKESWKVTLIDTGINTMTGGRLRRAKSYIDGTFMFTYGDGVADINLKELLSFHTAQGSLLTLTAVQPEGRFGAIEINGHMKVASFSEKPKGDKTWVNGGFFVCEPGVIDYIHKGSWYCMDTLRDKLKLEKLWAEGKASWRIWE